MLSEAEAIPCQLTDYYIVLIAIISHQCDVIAAFQVPLSG